MKRFRIFGYCAACAVCGFLWACSGSAVEETTPAPDNGIHRIVLMNPGITAYDMGAVAPQADQPISPPLATELNVHLSDGFSDGDEIGFFSIGGKIGEDGHTSTDFVNQKLRFSHAEKGFVSQDFNAEADAGRMERVFAYYPFTENMEIPDKAEIYTTGDGGAIHAIDFMTTDWSKGGDELYSSTNFYHTFSIVRVMLGKGFTDFKGDVYLQMKRWVGSVHIDMDKNTMSLSNQNAYNSTGITGYAVRLDYDDTKTAAAERRLQAFFNKGEIEHVGDKTVDNRRWDVIVPCRPVQWYHNEDPEEGGVTVESIILKPQDRDEIPVPVVDKDVLKVYNGGWLCGLRGSYIYTVQVVKDGFDATVYPVSVQPWNTDENIQQTIPDGISSAEEFRDFVTTYNELFTQNKSYTKDEITSILKGSEAMQEYGNGAEGEEFTVFLDKDIDLSGSNLENLSISNLCIPIDGRGHTISNCHISHSFCVTMQNTGSLKDLYFNNLRVVQEAGAEDNPPIGLLVGTMEDGSIDGCRVTGGWLQAATSETKVGAAVGTMKNGTVKGCHFFGTMVGANDVDHRNLVGEYSGGTLDDSNRNNMTVQASN